MLMLLLPNMKMNTFPLLRAHQYYPNTQKIT